MAKALRERVGKQYTGTQRTRKAVHGECTVELAKWTFPIISLCREPYEAKVSRTGLTGAWGDVPSGNASCAYPVPLSRWASAPQTTLWGEQHGPERYHEEEGSLQEVMLG